MNLVILIILLGAVTIFSTLTIFENSEAQSSVPSNQLLSDSKVFIIVQTIVENSDGDLETYLTSDKFTKLNK